MTIMGTELSTDEFKYPYGQSPKGYKILPERIANECHCKGEPDKENISCEKPTVPKKTTDQLWFQYSLYIHLIILYFLVFSLYNELRTTKEALLEFHTKLINVSLRGMEMEKDCLSSQILNINEAFETSGLKRMKRSNPESDFGTAILDTQIQIHENVTSPLNSRVSHHRMIRKAPNEKRGKHHRKNKKHARRRRHGFPRATHFIGAFPEPIIRDGGVLAPWLVDKDAVKDFNLVTKVPGRGREAVEIIESGLYFIYAQQVYYMSPNDSTKAHSSFFVMSAGPADSGAGGERMLAQCATLGDSALGGEASCFTATAASLRAGEVVFLKQRERERYVVMKRGQTFLGLILLNKRLNDKTNHPGDMKSSTVSTLFL